MTALKWTKEKRIETTRNILDENLPKLKEMLDKIDFSNYKEVRKLEEWIIKENIKLPINKNFPGRLPHHGILNLYREACGQPESDWYIPFLDESSEHFSPWILQEEMRWNKDLEKRALDWLFKKRSKEGKVTRKSILNLSYDDLRENKLYGIPGFKRNCSVYELLEKHGYIENYKIKPWDINRERVPRGTWKKRKIRKEALSLVAKKTGKEVYEIKAVDVISVFPSLYGYYRGSTLKIKDDISANSPLCPDCKILLKSYKNNGTIYRQCPKCDEYFFN